MVYRKLAGFDKHGKPWVNLDLPQRLAKPIMRHQKEFARQRLKNATFNDAVAKARRIEHKGMSKREITLYELDIARRTPALHGQQSYSPLRQRR